MNWRALKFTTSTSVVEFCGFDMAKGTALYLSQEGPRLSGSQLGRIVHHYIDAGDIGKGGSCHLFRHTMATAMLENGADIRYIPSMLGHASLDTTQIYTRVSIRKLKEIHNATHPAKNRQRNPASSRQITPNSLKSKNSPRSMTSRRVVFLLK